jgi:hypothetical protein
MSESNHAWREFDVCIPYAAIAANKRHIQKRHEKFIVARGSRDSDIWSGTCSNGSQMSESNHEGFFGAARFKASSERENRPGLRRPRLRV